MIDDMNRKKGHTKQKFSWEDNGVSTSDDDDDLEDKSSDQLGIVIPSKVMKATQHTVGETDEEEEIKSRGSHQSIDDEEEDMDGKRKKEGGDDDREDKPVSSKKLMLRRNIIQSDSEDEMEGKDAGGREDESRGSHSTTDDDEDEGTDGKRKKVGGDDDREDKHMSSNSEDVMEGGEDNELIDNANTQHVREEGKMNRIQQHIQFICLIPALIFLLYNPPLFQKIWKICEKRKIRKRCQQRTR
jgi:hypothetical protein